MKRSIYLIVCSATFLASCSAHALTAEDKCEQKSLRDTPAWWICMDNERMISALDQIKREVVEIQSRNVRARFSSSPRHPEQSAR